MPLREVVEGEDWRGAASRVGARVSGNLIEVSVAIHNNQNATFLEEYGERIQVLRNGRLGIHALIPIDLLCPVSLHASVKRLGFDYLILTEPF